MRFSRRTLAALGRLMAVTLSRSDIIALFYEFHIDSGRSEGNKLTLSINFLRGFAERYQDDEADHLINEITERVLSKALVRSPRSDEYEALIFNLRLEGFEYAEGRLRPTTPVPAALAPEISAFENDINQQGIATSSVHYTQAVNNFTDGNWEACNGQIRSFMEDFLISIDARLTGNDRNNVVASLQDLQSGNYLDHEELNQIKSFWNGIQDNGPHRGLSSEQEALFRLHVSTAIARYLIFKLSLSTA